MIDTKRLVTALLATALAAAPFAGAQEGNGPHAREQADKLVLTNDHVTVWFHGKKPFLKVFPGEADENGTEAFSLRFHRVVEFNDENGNGAPEEDEVVSFLNLQAATGWDVTIVDEEDQARITLTLADAVKLRGPANLDVGLPTRDANVTLVFHVFKDERALTTDTGENVTVPAGHVKYDFLVDAWPWLDAAENHVALDLVTSADVSLATDEAGVAAVADNGTTVGTVTWAKTASAVDANGENVTTNVTASILEDAEDAGNVTDTGNGTADDEGATLTRLAFAYDASGFRSLLHDPTIGVASTGGAEGEVPDEIAERLRDVPAPGALAVLGVAAVGALAVTFRGRSR